MNRSKFLVRVTPLIKGVPGEEEIDSSGRTQITLGMTTPITQFGDLEVRIRLNEGRTSTVKVSMEDPVIENLVKYEFASHIGLQLPGDTQPETHFWGQSNLKKHFKEGVVIFDAQDPIAGKGKYHQVRRGDVALNVDPERGSLRSTAYSMEEILMAAHNTPEQQDRDMPCFAFPMVFWGDFVGADIAPFIGYERFRGVMDLCQQIIASVYGPDVDCLPEWVFPAKQYGWMNCYDPIISHLTPVPNNNLGRYLVPDDPDNPGPNEVVFDYGRGLDNCIDIQENPGRPTTHAHVYDSQRWYRETAADAVSSGKIGAWVDALDAGFDIKKPSNGETVDTTPLRAIADAIVRGHGVPPAFMTVSLRPVDAQTRHFGHPMWAVDGPGLTGEGGHFYIGDYVLVRARKGYASFETVAKIMGVTLKQKGWNGLPQVDVDLIPAVLGEAGDNTDEATA